LAEHNSHSLKEGKMKMPKIRNYERWKHIIDSRISKPGDSQLYDLLFFSLHSNLYPLKIEGIQIIFPSLNKR
jgi:hypothetical protein